MIIANPSSGKKQAEEYAVRAKEILERSGSTVVVKLTKQKSDIEKFAKTACSEKFDQIVVLGGDGTVSELGNALKNEEYRPKIGIIPAGTINNIARGLGIATNMNRAVQDLPNCREKKVDAGLINDRLFLSSVSAGSIPETVWEVTDEQKENLGPMAYFIEGFKSIREEEPYSIKMNLDGEEKERELSLLLIGLSSSVAGIPNFFRNAEYDDGYLYMFGLKKSTFGEKVSVLTTLISGSEALSDENNKGFICKFKEGTIENDYITNVALDGEKGPSFPFSVKILPSFFTFLVPQI